MVESWGLGPDPQAVLDAALVKALYAVRLMLAAACGAAVGWQRQRADKSAGLRTHMLMAAGACLFTLVTLSLGEGDPQRVVQGMLMGTGFIAGGVIFRQGPSVHGLTTAVGLWVTSAVGLAVGLGDYFLAIATTVLTLVVMSTFQRLERKAARAPAAEDGGGPPPPDASGRA